MVKNLSQEVNELEARKGYQIEIIKRCAAMENLSDGEDIKWA